MLEMRYREKLHKESLIDQWTQGENGLLLLGFHGVSRRWFLKSRFDLTRKALENLMVLGLRVRILTFASSDEDLSSFDEFDVSSRLGKQSR